MSTNYQSLEMAIFWYRELRVGKECETEKTHYFYSNPLYFTLAKSSGAASEGRSRQLYISGMLQTLKIATKGVPYFNNINKLYSVKLQKVAFTSPSPPPLVLMPYSVKTM